MKCQRAHLWMRQNQRRREKILAEKAGNIQT
jgi:hypothetical protein